MFRTLLLSLLISPGAFGAELLAPYPQSPVIAGISWAQKSEILRLANGSDNWPTAWSKYRPSNSSHRETASCVGAGSHSWAR